MALYGAFVLGRPDLASPCGRRAACCGQTGRQRKHFGDIPNIHISHPGSHSAWPTTSPVHAQSMPDGNENPLSLVVTLFSIRIVHRGALIHYAIALDVVILISATTSSICISCERIVVCASFILAVGAVFTHCKRRPAFHRGSPNRSVSSVQEALVHHPENETNGVHVESRCLDLAPTTTTKERMMQYQTLRIHIGLSASDLRHRKKERHGKPPALWICITTKQQCRIPGTTEADGSSNSPKRVESVDLDSLM